MYSAKRAQIRFERSNPRPLDSDMLSSQYNTNQSENRPMMSSVVDNGGGESELDKNKKLRNSKTSNNFIKKNI